MPNKRSKRYRAAAEKVDVKKSYPLAEAVSVLKTLPATKFDQTVTLSFRLGVDPKQSDQMVRGTTPLPHGSGKNVRVLVFAEGQAATAAREAGAEFVGYKDIIEKVTGGFQDFDVAIATPAAMAEVRKLGKVLGPRGLMPNPKTGTVTPDPAKAVTEIKGGKIEFRTDRHSNLHFIIGKASFSELQLAENYAAALEEVLRLKPASSKGRYIRKVTLSTTMGPGVQVDPNRTKDVANSEGSSDSE